MQTKSVVTSPASTVSAFAGETLLASGPAQEVALAVKAAVSSNSERALLVFDDRTGRQVDFDLSGNDADVAARLAPAGENDDGPAPARRTSGRPKLGVVPREVTLLPRHWAWLAVQPGGASATLRRLVDAARSAGSDAAAARQACEAADRFMAATVGNRPGYEEASRALYAGEHNRFMQLSEPWPADLRDHARRLAAPSFSKSA